MMIAPPTFLHKLFLIKIVTVVVYFDHSKFDKVQTQLLSFPQMYLE